jgi:hypothetical protein
MKSATLSKHAVSMRGRDCAEILLTGGLHTEVTSHRHFISNGNTHLVGDAP